MGIKETRKKRASEFISVRHLLTGIAEAEGISVGEVAGELLFQFKIPGKNPTFYCQDQSTLVMEAITDIHLFTILEKVSSWCGFNWPSVTHSCPDDADRFGWNREEIGTFTVVFLHCFPECCDPNWEPISELLPITLSDSDKSSDNLSIEYPTPDDVDHENWPERLGIAITAWRAACNADLSETTPREYMKVWLSENYHSIPALEVDRLATVANWDTSRGRPSKKGKK